MSLTDKVSYLKGLAEGLKVSDATNEGKLLLEIIKTLDAFAEEINEQQNQIEELDDYLAEVDGDLEMLEEMVYDEDDDCDCDCDDDDCDCGCHQFDDDFEEIVCPKCHEIIHFEGDIDEEDSLCCPVCGEVLLNNDEETDEEDQ